MKHSLVIILNDAAGCYDRIRPNQAELCSPQVGCTTSLIKTHTCLQMKMTHHVKTSAEILRGYIKFDGKETNAMDITNKDKCTICSGNIGGVGQGGGASPIEWLVFLITLMNASKVFSHGTRLIDPERVLRNNTSNQLCGQQ